MATGAEIKALLQGGAPSGADLKALVTAPEPEAPGMVEGVAQQVGQGITLGFSDELLAGVMAPFAAWQLDQPLGEAYTGLRDQMRGDQQAFAEENPNIALAAEVGGGLATGGVGAVRAAGTRVLQAASPALRGVSAGAGVGAAAGAGYSDAEDPTGLAVDTATGGAFGGAVGAALPAMARVIQRVIGKVGQRPNVKVFDESGRFTQEAMEELQAAAQRAEGGPRGINDLIVRQAVDEGVMTPEQAERFNLFRSRGVEPNRANVTQSVDDWTEVQSGIKTTGPVADNVAAQDARMIELAEEGIENLAPVTRDVAETNANILATVENVADRADAAVGAAYQAARSRAPNDAVVSVNALREALKRNAGRENISGGVVSAVRQEMRNRGLLKEGAGPITVNEAEEVRQVMNSLFDGASPLGRSLIRDFKNALDEDVAEAVGEDIFAEARQQKQQFQRIFERSRRNKFDRSKGGLLEDILYNKIPEDRIMQRLIGAGTRKDDLVKLRTFLLEDAGVDGIQTWANLKAQVLREGLDDATRVMGRGANGQQVFNARLFRNYFDRLKKSGKYQEIFNTDERQLIEDLIEIGNLRTPIAAVQQGKGPTELAVEEMNRSLRAEIVRRVPVIGDGAQALIDALTEGRAARRQVDPGRETSEYFRRRGSK